MKNERRIQTGTLGVSKEVLPFHEKHNEVTYFQVVVGNYGVVVPNVINIETMKGLQLVKEKATRIESKELAERIAIETNGKLLEVTELFKRTVIEV
ncbi:hypothetical protein BRE01_67380 [Brevibacillus reuszeri]|uniref:Uncharacterized protein n=1 Tax=Brevibacillus reuszeri TaxID=54915 RepID=A0ABQ0TZ49_9BACL|nr:hypothetical protein [Brevibacillus reuszeri]GED73036.1 hypothetical protein BRE01_67380 [Brevibacillus reuszeri]